MPMTSDQGPFHVPDAATNSAARAEHNAEYRRLYAGWGYRVCKRMLPVVDGMTEAEFGIIEVYYDAEDPTKIASWSDRPAPAGDNLTDLRATLELMLGALDKPVLDYEDLPGVARAAG